jgi:hypothetical protein
LFRHLSNRIALALTNSCASVLALGLWPGSRHSPDAGLTALVATWTGETGLPAAFISLTVSATFAFGSAPVRAQGLGGFDATPRGTRLFFLPQMRTKMTQTQWIVDLSRWSPGCP